MGIHLNTLELNWARPWLWGESGCGENLYVWKKIKLFIGLRI
jgi:hypothetical protein